MLKIDIFQIIHDKVILSYLIISYENFIMTQSQHSHDHDHDHSDDNEHNKS